MSLPKSIIKVKKDGIEFISNVDRVQYTISELERAALKDVAKFLRKQVKNAVPVDEGVLKKNVGTWVKKKDSSLQIGVYNSARAKKKHYKYAYHAHLVHFGTIKTRPVPFLRDPVFNNLDKIRLIQGKYLSAIEDENRALGLLDEDEEIADD